MMRIVIFITLGFYLSSESFAQTPDANLVDAGRKLYTSFCARCHGINMVNNGSSFDLRTFPKEDRARFEKSITQGVKAMPAWGDKFSVDEMNALWAYVSQPRE